MAMKVMNAKKKKAKKAPRAKAAPKPESPAEPVAVVDEAAEAERLASEEAARIAQVWEEWPTEQVEISKIICEGRYRPEDEMDLPTIIESIQKFGLLQPIGIRPAEDGMFRLVQGARRLKAIESMGRETIKAVVFNLDGIVSEDEQIARYMEMEVEENECRRNPSLRHKVARYDAINAVLKKLGKGKKGDTPRRERAAKVAGISPESKRQADIVFTAAEKEPKNEVLQTIAKKMDTDKLPISQAYQEVLREKLTMDMGGIPLTTKRMKDAFISRDQYKHIIGGLKLIQKQIDEIANDRGGERLILLPPELILGKDKDGVTKYTSPSLAQLIKALEESAPYVQCPVCAAEEGELGKGKKSCTACSGSQHVGEDYWDGLVKAGDSAIAKLKKLGKAAEAAA